MMQTIARFGISAERAMHLVYTELSNRFPGGSEQQDTLIDLAEEERAHSLAMALITANIPADAAEEPETMALILAEQSVFIDEALDILAELQGGEQDLAPLVDRLALLETTLVERLLPRFAEILPPEHHGAVQGLMEQTSAHSDRIRSILA